MQPPRTPPLRAIAASRETSRPPRPEVRRLHRKSRRPSRGSARWAAVPGWRRNRFARRGRTLRRSPAAAARRHRRRHRGRGPAGSRSGVPASRRSRPRARRHVSGCRSWAAYQKPAPARQPRARTAAYPRSRSRNRSSPRAPGNSRRNTARIARGASSCVRVTAAPPLPTPEPSTRAPPPAPATPPASAVTPAIARVRTWSPARVHGAGSRPRAITHHRPNPAPPFAPSRLRVNPVVLDVDS
jgi:hypothetical protein